MMNLSNRRPPVWNPWEGLENDMRRLLRQLDAYPGGEFPQVNIWSDSELARLTAELPGVDPAKLEVAVQHDTVTLRGEREAAELKDGESWLRRERATGSFVRSFALPFKVDASQVTAHCEHGVLTVTLPRSEEEKPRRIAVRT